MPSIETIREAEATIRPFLRPTPLVYSIALSEELGADVWLKLEFRHRTGSFKERGALNKLLNLTEDERQAGVCASSAGNHAQALAYHATRLGIRSLIVMPLATPLVKVEATRKYGAEILLEGYSFDDAKRRALELADERGMLFVSAFDDPFIISGQGTMGLETVRQLQSEGVDEADVLISSVGGGGMLSGLALSCRDVWPDVEIWAAESIRAASLAAAIAQGHPLQVTSESTIADGIAVKTVGELPFQILQSRVSRLFQMTDLEISAAMLYAMERERYVLEGAAAVSVAVALKHREELRGRKVVVVLSGGNVDVNLLERIISGAMAQRGRLSIFNIITDDRPGQLASILTVVANAGASVIDVHQTRAHPGLPFGGIEIELTLETRGVSHRDDLQQALRMAGFVATLDDVQLIDPSLQPWTPPEIPTD